MMARETRIDIVRGIAILVILLNHLTQVAEFGGLRGWMIPTPSRYGYSSAAELFVFMSGYMVGLVYLQRPHPVRAIVRRAATLWTYNAALLAILFPLLLLMSPAELAFWRLDGFATAPVAATLRFLLLQEAPRLLDVLQLYIKLMLLAPVAIAIHRRSPALLIALSVAVYALAQLLTIRHLAAVPDGNTDGALDLMSWQLLFFVPMTLGAMRAHLPLFRALERNRAVLVLLASLFVAAAVAKAYGAEPLWFSGRYGLHLLRLSHAMLVLLFYASALTLAGGILARGPFPAIARIGRHSLDCFAGGVLLTYGLGTLWLHSGGGRIDYYAFAALGVACTAALARSRDARKARAAPPLRPLASALPPRPARAGPSGS